MRCSQFLNFLKTDVFFGGMGGSGDGDADRVRITWFGCKWAFLLGFRIILQRLRGNELRWRRIGYGQVVEALGDVVDSGLRCG